MIVVPIVVGIVGLVVYEVRADRRVRRSTAGATPVVIVRGLRPRWWRQLLGKALGFVLQVAAFAAVGLLALHLLHNLSAPAGIDHTWPMPGASTPSPTHGATPTSPTVAKGR